MVAFIGECIQCTIRWPRYSIRGPATTAKGNVILEAARVFQCANDTPVAEVNVGKGAPPMGTTFSGIPSVVESNNAGS